ncbi:unnamed protein product [Acanthocheilonema viteae]|uniref:Uncharacterized protein n=1 Tax=Acanthocheilonema viteae TaxID=6277 RepID=A0A498SLL2_ACAVI|nr:unnamed protein product [Acanthocheilonema viteae]
MQNIRGRARMLGRRHARVHFNLGNRLRSSSALHETFPEDATRDSMLKQILVTPHDLLASEDPEFLIAARIKKSERELTTCRSRTNELLNIQEDSLTTARINHERYLLDDLIDYVESLIGDKMNLQTVDKVLLVDNQRWYAKRLKRGLLNWIARNETELKEIDALENRVMKRYLQISHENKYLQRIFRDMKYFTNATSDSFKTMEISSEPTFTNTSKTQSSLTNDGNEEKGF